MRSRGVGITTTRSYDFFLYISASAADAAAVTPKEIKTLLASGLITFFINDNQFLVMDQVIY